MERTSLNLACNELARFFTIANESGLELEMFSPCIDGFWHELRHYPEQYADFCRAACDRDVEHSKASGAGLIAWVTIYHDRFGPLPDIWFADADGIVDWKLYKAYQETGKVWASWDCTPLVREIPKLTPPPTKPPYDEEKEARDSPVPDEHDDDRRK